MSSILKSMIQRRRRPKLFPRKRRQFQQKASKRMKSREFPCKNATKHIFRKKWSPKFFRKTRKGRRLPKKKSFRRLRRKKPTKKFARKRVAR